MARSANTKWIITALTVAGIAGALLAGAYVYRHDIKRDIERASLPEAVEYSKEAPVASSLPLPTRLPVSPSTPAAVALPAEVNLAVPFTPQAPHANWDDPYGEFCEEASVLMAMRYVNQQAITSPEDADTAMQAIKAFEDTRFGYYKDTTAAETAAIITEHFKYSQIELVKNPTAADIRSALAAGKPVIVPAAGRLLGNPYFQTPGPLYHMLVIKGYAKDGRFITNDPGTRRGADFLYDEHTLMNAMHDWRTDRNIEQGGKVIIIVG